MDPVIQSIVCFKKLLIKESLGLLAYIQQCIEIYFAENKNARSFCSTFPKLLTFSFSKSSCEFVFINKMERHNKIESGPEFYKMLRFIL